MSAFKQIIPDSQGGIADYAYCLREAGLKGEVIMMSARSTPSLQQGDSVLLHYSGYGYAKRGAPAWLLKWLLEQRPLLSSVGIFFHELYATGLPWRSSFWLSFIQKKIAIQLAETSDYWITNRQASADWLINRDAISNLGRVLPIPSTIGELNESPEHRNAAVVVFGGPSLREATYVSAGTRLWDWVDRFGLLVHDIGPPIPGRLGARIGSDPRCRVHGRLPAKQVQIILASSMWGLTSYPLAFAAKSSVVGAYCAHGVCPVILSDPGISEDGLIGGRNCMLDFPKEFSDLERANSVAYEARRWYQGHSISVHVSAILDQKALSLC